MDKFKHYLRTKYSHLVIWLFIPVSIITSFSHHRWVNPESVIDWDVKSYYAYLPAAFIHGDLTLSFIDENPQEYYKWFWPVTTPTGKRCIVTSMGMSVLYSPFFFIAHLIAHVGGYPTDGYSMPYAFALHFSALFYLIAGLFFLRKLLRKFFGETTVLITLIAVYAGTNLFYYANYAAAMSHCHNFALISIFIYYADKWHCRQSIKLTIALGLLSGLIALIRPTNILVLVLFALWGVGSLSSLKERTVFFIKHYKLVLLMVLFFFLVWSPQFVYWKYVSGKFLYFSYSGLDGRFYWLNPQIFDILLSYRKGWWVYTPLMFIATLGIIVMAIKMRKYYLGVLVFLLINIYVQASWWCWWFGGSFGLRAFIDSYGIMAIPFAALVQYCLSSRVKTALVVIITGSLTWYNTFQVKQLNKQALHYWWMSKDAYWMNFLKTGPRPEYWEKVPVPDYPKARQGIYVAKNLITRFDGYKNIRVEPGPIVEEIKRSVVPAKKHKKLADKHNISVDSVLTIEAWNIYERKSSLDKYIRPLVAARIADSLLKDTLYLDASVQNWQQLTEPGLKTILLEKALEQIKNEKF
ncbi:MAG: hypothetical protein JXB34_02570 [Bacteroidales bacterium]|nr:hypothetical protein [Bacteroidales bacterium]